MPWKEVWRSEKTRTGSQAYLNVFEEPNGQWSQGEILVEREERTRTMMLSAGLTAQDLSKLEAILSRKV